MDGHRIGTPPPTTRPDVERTFYLWRTGDGRWAAFDTPSPTYSNGDPWVVGEPEFVISHAVPPTPEDPDLLLARKVVALVAGNAARHHLHPDPKAYESGACDHGTSVQAVLAVIRAGRGE